MHESVEPNSLDSEEEHSQASATETYRQAASEVQSAHPSETGHLWASWEAWWLEGQEVQLIQLPEEAPKGWLTDEDAETQTVSSVYQILSVYQST